MTKGARVEESNQEGVLVQLGREEVRSESGAVRWRGYVRAELVDIFDDELGFGLHIMEALNNSGADALIRTRAAVEDTADQAGILQLCYSSSRKSNQNRFTSWWLPLHPSQAHLFQARLAR
ncbi:hypothetical protein G6011_10457 [Alternaria panax]|uniref:Uncharacterized protein n=1 Tax=Alternaria panax TaxID=48097 RepID=A0AAD4NPR9_9PLEO|nr:hypothetical protein G6011_10457 [Alternaria panax]